MPPRSLAPGATIAFVPSGETPRPPPPSVPSATEAEMAPLEGSMRTSREAARCRPLRGVVAEIQARPRWSRLTPAAPASLTRRTSRPEVRSSTATAPPCCTSIARVGVTTSSIGVPASLRWPVRCMLATSIDSIAPLRAAKTFVPSAETASASGVPVVRMLPAPMRVARSMTETVRPAAT